MKFHFIGIGGIGMSALARILLQKGMAVSGSDILHTPLIESLVEQGALFYRGQSEKNIHTDRIVVLSSDIKKDNVEYAEAVRQNCHLMHRSDLLAYLASQQCPLAVAGTHGKTTTSALLTSVLVAAECDPSFAIGGVLPQFQTNSRFGQGEYFVLEADESDRTFLKYHPYGAIITNIDHDHLSNYGGDPNNLIQAFRKFTDQVQNKTSLFWCGEDPYLRDLDLPGYSYGRDENCHWQLVNVRHNGFTSLFDLIHADEVFKNIELSLIGIHNALNASGVFAMAHNLGIKEDKIRRGLANFQGVQRRCENKGTFNQILFLDDYAHHPTEIETTLQGIRQAIGKKRLVAVFQPHRYSRTQECQGLFAGSFKAADKVLVTDIYAAGEKPIDALNGEMVMKEIRGNVKECHYVPRTALSTQLSHCLQAEDVVVTLGAGDITHLSKETLLLLKKIAE